MYSPDEYLTIDTPENVSFGYEVAGIGSRFMAALVDTLLILVLQALVLFATVAAFTILGEPTQDSTPSAAVWMAAILGLISFALLWGYYVFFETRWNGQSPGKRWVGLRVIRSDGTPVTLTESLVRNLVRLVDFLPAYYGVGVVTMFIDGRSRRLGDMAAGTLVVRDKDDVRLESLGQRPGARLERETATEAPPGLADLPVERLTERDIVMAEEFLQRRYKMTRSTAASIALRVARALVARMEIDPIPAGSERAIALIEQVVRASREPE